ncbi:LOW QUALITY PROTEIN: PGAP2-interacting protein [Liasis olivaceus]
MGVLHAKGTGLPLCLKASTLTFLTSPPLCGCPRSQFGACCVSQHNPGVIMVFIISEIFTGGRRDLHCLFGIKNSHKPLFKERNRCIKLFLWLFVNIGLLGLGLRYKAYVKKLGHGPPKKDFSAFIWPLRFGYDNERFNLERSAILLNQAGADFITVMESDASRLCIGKRDPTMWLGQKLGFYTDFGPSKQDHSWGMMVLSRYQIVKSSHHLFPSEGEIASAIFMIVNFIGKLVNFVIAHFGNEEEDLDRKLQAISELLKMSSKQVVFLAYIMSVPGSGGYLQLIVNVNVKDTDNTDYDQWCSYLMYCGLIRPPNSMTTWQHTRMKSLLKKLQVQNNRLGYAQISHAHLNSELEIGKFGILGDPENYTDNEKATTNPTEVPEEIHFSSRLVYFKNKLSCF